MKSAPLLVAVVTILVAAASPSRAADCTYTATEMQDTFYSNVAGNNIALRIDAFVRFDFDADDWDGGFGYHDQWNNNKPFARTMNALSLLAWGVTPSPTCSTSSSNVGMWGYCWSGTQIDELDARCGNGSSRARTFFGGFDDYTELYLPFFYNETVMERTATIFHEARHAHGWCKHDKSGGACDDNGDCESSWGDGCHGFGSGSGGGAFTYSVLMLNWLATTARSGWINDSIRANAVAEANRILNTYYVTDPCFRLNSQGFAVTSC